MIVYKSIEHDLFKLQMQQFQSIQGVAPVRNALYRKRYRHLILEFTQNT
jgi:hypothetical protein